MKDEYKRERKLLRPSYTFEFNGKGIKKLNRRIVRKRLKEQTRQEIKLS